MKNRIFEIFKEITAIPRGSGNMKPIADYCVEFAKSNSLDYIRDEADNVIIFKKANSKSTEPIIMQGHLDMVCQQTADSKHDFNISGPEIVIDGDFIKAKDTTLGADNGIAVAIILAILESKDLIHPPIEAVFTVDEEVGMLGATALDTTPLKSKRMINLDSEEDDTVTVSCAGGSDFIIKLPATAEKSGENKITVTLFGLKGGHSGVEIDKGRVNANILAGRILNHLYNTIDFRIASINGGERSNAITPQCEIILSCDNVRLISEAESYLNLIKKEISAREPNFDFSINISGKAEKSFSKELTEKLIFLLVNAPNGIMEMSAEIEGLVETSLNLGILKTDVNGIFADFSLRSNKLSAIDFLEERLCSLAKAISAEYETVGHYPPWEYKPDSILQEIYVNTYDEIYGKAPKIAAIHAGLECGVFDSKIKDLSAIAVGPQMYDVHTVNERLSVSSTEKFTELIVKVLEKL